MKIFEKTLNEFKTQILDEYLKKEKILIKMRPLKPEEAIGYPKRNDYPLLLGKEVLIQAEFNNSKGQAFTDEPYNFCGKIKDILTLKFTTNRERALFISTMNAVMRELKLVDGTVHCKNDEPENCAKKVVNFIFNKYGKIKIALVGLQPAFATALIEKFEAKNIYILDLDIKNFSKKIKGVPVLDSKKYYKDILKKSDLTLATGSTIVNDTIDEIIKYSNEIIFYGVTIAGASKLLNLNRLCENSH